VKGTKTISDPEAFKLLADATRRRILFLLRAKEMNVSEVATELEITPQTVYHHVKKLVQGGMVEVTREVRCDHLIESYYQATAEAFIFLVGKTSSGTKAAREQMEAALGALKRIGFKIEYDEKTLSRLVELEIQIDECYDKARIVDELAKLEDIDLPTQLQAIDYASILTMSNEKAYDRLQKDFRDLLKSTLKEKPQLTAKGQAKDG